jgi:hypothetical protein
LIVAGRCFQLGDLGLHSSAFLDQLSQSIIQLRKHGAVANAKQVISSLLDVGFNLSESAAEVLEPIRLGSTLFLNLSEQFHTKQFNPVVAKVKLLQLPHQGRQQFGLAD